MLKLRRVTSGGRFIPEIDGLRFIAITSVLLFHIHGSLTHHGAVESPGSGQEELLRMLSKRGVELFFCISGFILSLPFARAHLLNLPKINLKTYFLRRLTRLEPPYILSLLICAAAYLATGAITLRILLPHLLAGTFYLHNFLFGYPNLVNVAAWSLEVEVQFYLLVPILVSVFAIRNNSARKIVLILAIAISALASIPLRNTWAEASVLYYAPFFLAGFLVSNSYVVAANAWTAKKSAVWDIVSILGWPAVWLLGPTAGHVFLPFLFVLLFMGAFRGRLASFLLSINWITDIGGMCYSIYLLHLLVIAGCGRLTKPLHLGHSFLAYFLLQSSLILPVVFFVSALFFLAVERPCMDRNWPSKLNAFVRGRRSRQVPTTP